MQDFADTAHCRLRRNCVTCRDVKSGKYFRLSVVGKYSVPGNVVDFECPIDVPWGVSFESVPPSQPQATVPTMATVGPDLWHEIHTRTNADAAYVASIAQRLPCGDCRASWIGTLAELPPIYGDGWFSRSVEWHNRTNRKLGKAEMTIEEAIMRWRDRSH